MKKITLTVTNARLKMDLTVHFPGPTFQINSVAKTVSGQIQCYKSEKIEDAMIDGGLPQPSLVVPYTFGFETYDKMDEQIQKHIEDNIATLASR